ncbi:GNAT family N-acetyltransferase [Paraglaciecola sp.]|uniref:GNAT family N-acetyltransferase n=1 Tax=Paraglaciecola sp. TaxID=1920173 RepID=UPI0030F3ADC1
MKVRHIQDRDWNRIIEIQKQSYPVDLIESKGSLQAKEMTSTDTCFVVEIDNNIEGYLLAMPYTHGKSPSINSVEIFDKNSNNLHIHDFCISASHKKNGYGRKIIKDLISASSFKCFKSISVISVMKSQYFWESIGLSVVEPKEPQALSSYGNDAIYLSMKLT